MSVEGVRRARSRSCAATSMEAALFEAVHAVQSKDLESGSARKGERRSPTLQQEQHGDCLAPWGGNRTRAGAEAEQSLYIHRGRI